MSILIIMVYIWLQRILITYLEVPSCSRLYGVVSFIIYFRLSVSLASFFRLYSLPVTATQSIKEPSTVIQRAHACMIGLSMDSDIKMRSRRRWWEKGHVYIHMPSPKREPLNRSVVIL